MSAPRIDVVIPVRDGERYLAAAIDSITGQAPFEGATLGSIIVVDDGSTDASAAVARAASPRVRVVSLPPSGIAAARNAGLAVSDSEWLAFLDADDLWTADKLARQVPALLAQPDALILGRVEELVSPDLDDAARARLRPKPGQLPGWLVGAMLVARATFDRIGPFDASVPNGTEAIAWFAQAKAALPAVVLDALVLVRRLHDRNFTLIQAQSGHGNYLALARMMLAKKRQGDAPGGQ